MCSLSLSFFFFCKLGCKTSWSFFDSHSNSNISSLPFGWWCSDLWFLSSVNWEFNLHMSRHHIYPWISLFLLSWSGFYYVVLLGLQNLNWFSSCALETNLLSAWWVAKLWSLTIIPALETGWILVCLGWESGFLLLCVFLRPDSSLRGLQNLDSYNSCSWDQMDSCLLGQVLIIHALETRFLSA
jgi:hypothetical protein